MPEGSSPRPAILVSARLLGVRCTHAGAASPWAATAVLKARSPSCGCAEVYDGTFTRTRVPGYGVTVRALREAGVTVRSDGDVAREAAAPGPLSGDGSARIGPPGA